LSISVNQAAMRVVDEILRDKNRLGISMEKDSLGTIILDAGVKASGGYGAGIAMTELCLAGLGKASLFHAKYGDVSLPSIFVETGYPAIATLGSQFAGWQIKTENYSAMGSGPGRALALKPKELYERIEYQDKSEKAILILESDSKPPREAIDYISKKCSVSAENLTLMVAPTSSIAGSVQISGRIVETGIHKLTEIGFDPKKILHGCGYAPIAPIHPKAQKAMGRTNDAIYYGGEAYYTVDFEDDEKLKGFVARAPSSTAKEYGRPFFQILKAVKYDFYSIDPNLFAPAVVTINNVRTGATYTAGKINPDVLKATMEMSDA
jgi:methenyltetrahydromethanopterin cyclohydrolase